MRLGIFGAAIAMACAAPLLAGGTIELTRSVFHERIGDSGAGRTVVPARELRKGDNVILVVRWNSKERRQAFNVSAAIPSTLTYRASSVDDQTVSIDGGKSWGRLDALVVRDGAGKRFASPEDVTHLRWRIGAREAARGSGQLTYSAIVR